jgi:hypothetical protein
MNIYPKTDKILPNDLVMKVMACFAMLYIPMVFVMKFFPPIIYGTAATPGIVGQTITAMVMPSLMIGIGMLALRAQTGSLLNLLIRSLVTSILISGLALWAGLPIFMGR